MFINFIKPSIFAPVVISLVSNLTSVAPTYAVNLTGWETFGDAITQSNSAEITNALSDGSDDPTNFNVSGNDPQFAFNLELELGLDDGALNLESGDTSAIIYRDLSVQAGEVFSFDWIFATNHQTSESQRNDYAFLVINQQVISLVDTYSPLTSPGINGFPRKLEDSFAYEFLETGNYTLAIGVSDVFDDITSSTLIVSNLNLQTKAIPEPSIILGIAIASGFGVYFKRVVH